MKPGVVFASVAWLALLTGPVAAQNRNAQPPVVTVVPPIPMGTPTRPVSFTRVVVNINRGQSIGSLAGGLLCLGPERLNYRGGRLEFSNDQFDTVFREEMEKAGFKVAGDPANLFETASPRDSEYAVAGAITAIQLKICYPYSGLEDFDSFKGTGSMDVEWQIYSRVEDKVVARVKTQGAFEQKRTINNLPDTLLLEESFAENVRKLAASNEFRSAFVGATRPAAERVSAPTQSILTLAGAPAAQTLPISDAVGSVVAIFAGDGHGSGFLVSSDGHLITNHHVVGDVKYVKVRWSDGFETLGEVIRSDRRRDVALVKTEPRGRQPLHLRTASAQSGEAVFAIGTPIDPKLQNTVTRGIVSANRIQDGFSFVQSDVAVNPGNSGGPLLDEQSRVIAITVSGDTRGEALNFFIPIRDALDFLALKVE